MPRKLDQPTRKVTLLLFDEDVETMQAHYPAVGYGPAIRILVRNHCKQLLEAKNRVAKQVPYELDDEALAQLQEETSE